ncbi:MAG: DNA repair protein RadC [Acidobacteria bacterium]|nr:DNA repair protein RadC [Acidobacteriota bacterium]
MSRAGARAPAFVPAQHPVRPVAVRERAAPLAVRERAPADRPRERLAALGASALSDAEVLALILRTGMNGLGVLDLAARVLTRAGGPAGLARATPGELARFPGLGPAKAAEVVAALELGRRAARALAAERPQILSAADAAALLAPRLAPLDHEESVALLLDQRHRVLREVTVGVGGVAQSPMDAREVFAAALREPCAAAVLVAHNHPSGDPSPSPDDVAVTRRLAGAGELVGIELLDHLIVAGAGWVSLRERGVFVGGAGLGRRRVATGAMPGPSSM